MYILYSFTDFLNSCGSDVRNEGSGVNCLYGNSGQ